MTGETEAQFARWWASKCVTGHTLRTSDGCAAQILFQGRPGGSSGPDFRDAVILLDGERRCGDIELHLTAAGWHAHHHDADPRYDSVILHVVARGPVPDVPTRLASGALAPIVLLTPKDRAQFQEPVADPWPCHARELSPTRTRLFLTNLGMARFEERVARFHRELSVGNELDRVLPLAIAEALGYGRDPTATRAVAHLIMTGQSPRGAVDALSAQRLRSFTTLLAARELSLGARCCGVLLAGGWDRLLSMFAPTGKLMSTKRAAIVLWNAVLPCLAAYGDRCGNRALSETARVVATHAPGLPSNAITRSMSAWLGWRAAPAGALAQQGLHHLHARWCRTKDCAACPFS